MREVPMDPGCHCVNFLWKGIKMSVTCIKRRVSRYTEPSGWVEGRPKRSRAITPRSTFHYLTRDIYPGLARDIVGKYLDEKNLKRKQISGILQQVQPVVAFDQQDALTAFSPSVILRISILLTLMTMAPPFMSQGRD